MQIGLAVLNHLAESLDHDFAERGKLVRQIKESRIIPGHQKDLCGELFRHLGIFDRHKTKERRTVGFAPGAGGDESPRKILPLFDENRIRGFGKQIIRGETKILHVSEQFFFLTLFLEKRDACGCGSLDHGPGAEKTIHSAVFFFGKKAPLAEHFPVGICRNGKAFCFCTLKVFAPQRAGGNVVVARGPVFGVVVVYFAAGDSTDRLAKLPAAELVMDKGYDVLLLTEDVDEFCLQIMRTYPRKDAEGKDGTVEFKNVNSGDLGLETEDEKKAAEEATTANKALFDAMKDALDGKVKEVKVSTRLKDHPVCLSADGPLSIEMEKVLSKQPGSEGVKSDKVLELNVNHPVFAVLKAAQEAGDTEKLKKYSALLYAQAQLIEGLPVDDPAAYAEAVCSLMQ